VDRIVREISGLVHPLSTLIELEVTGLGVMSDGFPISVTGVLDDVFLNMKMMRIECAAVERVISLIKNYRKWARHDLEEPVPTAINRV
jgi:hypothetical protein